MPEPVDRVEDDERDRAEAHATQEQEQEVLRAPVRRAGRNDPVLQTLALRPPVADHEYERRDQECLQAAHVFSLLPITRHVATSTVAASSHVTMPSGHGPRWPIAHPPRS